MVDSANVNFETKELKTILKTFGKFAAQSFRNTIPAVVISPPQDATQKVQLVLSTDHAYVTSTPVSEFTGQNVGPYALNSERLLQLALTGKQTTLSWENEKSQLQVKDGKISAALNIAVNMPDFRHLPTQIDSVSVPAGLMSALQRYSDVPFSYFKAANRETNPVTVKRNAAGNLEVHSDDSYSLIKLETDFPMVKDVGFKIAKYAFDALYSGKDDDAAQAVIGSSGFSVYAANSSIASIISGLNDDVANFDTVFSSVGNGWLTSCTFNPKLLLESIKPMISVLPKKDTVGAIINMSFKDDRVVLSIKHKDVGEVLIDNVEGVANIYNERSIRNVVLHLHPQAFFDFTSLLGDVEEAKMFANNQLIYYEASKKVLGTTISIKYLFPTVQV